MVTLMRTLGIEAWLRGLQSFRDVSWRWRGQQRRTR